MQRTHLNPLVRISLSLFIILLFLPKKAFSSNLETYFAYLPIVVKPYHPQNIFGVDGMDSLSTWSGFQQMVEANAGWMRPSPPLLWSQVESVEGEYRWENALRFEQNIEKIRTAGVEPIAVVLSTPSWAQAIPGVSCGKIKSQKLEAFGEFIFHAVQRYSQPPYSIRFWEIWNEPDVDPRLVDPDSGFGCWGDKNDEYYGGGYYSQMMRVVYQRIKQADSRAFVVIGGLLLDCDPLHPPVAEGCRSSRFLEGILREGRGGNFDGVALHDYEFYSGALGQYSNLNWNSRWNTTGPSLLAKIRYLKYLLRAYQVEGKFLISTENAILCDPCQNNPTFEETKAIFLVQVYAISLSEGLWGNLWHRVGDWRNSGLMNPDLTPRPAYLAFKYMSHVLEGYQFSRKLSEYPGIAGYEFHSSGKRIWIVWSTDGNPKTIQLYDFPARVTDIYGEPLPPESTIEVSIYPIYLFFE